MRVIEVTGYGGPEVVKVVERPDPEARPGSVRVDVSACALNPIDATVRKGLMAGRAPDPPFVPGWDFSGVTADGQRVVGFVPWFMDPQGAHQSVIQADPEWIAPLPDGVDLAEAATFPLNALTAHQAVEALELEPGETLLVTGGSGAVGGFAIQLAKRLGVRVTATASAGDEDYVRSLGADEIVPRDLPPGSADAVLDAAPAGPQTIKAVKDGGRFIGVLDPAAPQPERGITVLAQHVTPDRAALTALVRDYADGKLEPTRVAGTLTFDQAREAHERLEHGGFRGKLVLTP
jgi:NADPH2:quinone reductase